MTDPGNGNADGSHLDTSGPGSGEEGVEFMTNQLPHSAALTTCQRDNSLAQNLPRESEHRTGELRASQVEPNDGHVGHGCRLQLLGAQQSRGGKPGHIWSAKKKLGGGVGKSQALAGKMEAVGQDSAPSLPFEAVHVFSPFLAQIVAGYLAKLLEGPARHHAQAERGRFPGSRQRQQLFA